MVEFAVRVKGELTVAPFEGLLTAGSPPDGMTDETLIATFVAHPAP